MFWPFWSHDPYQPRGSSGLMSNRFVFFRNGTPSQSLIMWFLKVYNMTRVTGSRSVFPPRLEGQATSRAILSVACPTHPHVSLGSGPYSGMPGIRLAVYQPQSSQHWCVQFIPTEESAQCLQSSCVWIVNTGLCRCQERAWGFIAWREIAVCGWCNWRGPHSLVQHEIDC